MLSAIQGVVGDEHTKRHIGNLYYWLGDERLFGEKWWEDEAILARAREPLPPPPPPKRKTSAKTAKKSEL